MRGTKKQKKQLHMIQSSYSALWILYLTTLFADVYCAAGAPHTPPHPQRSDVHEPLKNSSSLPLIATMK